MKQLWSLEDVARYSSYGLSQVKKIVYRPDFPRPIRVFERSHPRWVSEEVANYFEARREA